MIITIEITANVSPVQIKGVRGHRSHLWKGTPIIVQRDSNSLGAVNRKKKMELSDDLYANLWEADPYVRARTIFDRNGFIELMEELHEKNWPKGS